MTHSTNASKPQAGLPYLNSLPLILLTVGVNLLMAFLFYFGRSITFQGFVTDSAICGMTSTIIGVAFVYWRVRQRRHEGALPQEVPLSPLMQRLPRNPVALIPLLGIVFALLMALMAVAVVWFFEIKTYSFARFAVWKVVYSFVLTAKIIELATLRFVQPDCAAPDDPPQTSGETVKNPLPRKETFANLFNTVVNDFGFNMVVGLLLGGVVIAADKSVIIPPTTRAGIVIGGLILGIIVAFRMVAPVVKSVAAVRDGGGLPPLPKRNPWVAWLPEKPILFALVLLLPIMLLSVAVLWAALTFFGFETLNFFQYFVVRTLYVTLLSKPVVALTIYRLRQPAKADASAGMSAGQQR